LLRRLLAVSLADAGSIKAARREIDAAMAELSTRDRAQSEVFRVAIHRSGPSADPRMNREVLAAAARALRSLERNGDEIWSARLRYNRGVLLMERGELEAAETDIRVALALYLGLGAEAAAIDASVVLAQLTLLRGDVVKCLAAIDEVRRTLPPGHLCFAIDGYHAVALTHARLLPEAARAVAEYLEVCARAGRGDFVSVVLLDAAAIAILSGDSASALHIARQAVRSFASRGKPVGAAQARAICLRARLLGQSLTRSSVRSGLEAAAVLEAAGWRVDGLRTRLLVARVALEIGADATARRELRLALALRSRGTVADRIELCQGRALLRLTERDVVGAERFLKDGLRLLEEYRAALGAAELRATASGIGTELSETGLRLAIDSDNPEKILGWAERLRGNALRLPLVRPPLDRQLRARQTDLRRVAAQIREAEGTGKPVRGLAARQSELETAIRARTRHVRGDGSASTAVPRPREAARALGDRVLVEYVELDGVLRAVTLAHGRLALHELGEVDATTELEWLRFALGRLARGGNSPAQRAAALGNAQAAAAALDRMLVEPLLPTLGEAPLVVVPTGALHALPWGALPSLRGRPVVVAPSLSLWVDLAGRPRSRRRKKALIAGPGLRHAATEVRDLAALFPGATVLRGKAATATEALKALDGAALAHVACHGRFRSDSPLFSALDLADGPLTVLDLQRLRRAPEVLVLSSCDLALSDRHPGDELLGLAAALLAMGTRTIIASVVPVPDAASRRLMLAFHRELAGGAPPASALAHAQAALQGRSAALAGFVCLGSG
jgi:hypothetical protein